MTSPNHEVEPASDEQITVLETSLLGPAGSSAFVDGIRKLIARIRAEQASKATELKAIVDAWEALPGGRDYGPKVVESWLIHHMAPAINRIRKLLQTGEETK